MSVGLVYDPRLFTPPAGGDDRAKNCARISWRIRSGARFCAMRKPVEHDMRAYSMLPYFSEKMAAMDG